MFLMTVAKVSICERDSFRKQEKKDTGTQSEKTV